MRQNWAGKADASVRKRKDNVMRETAKQAKRHVRGIFEKVKGSGIWWIRYCDASGKLRREKAGTKGMAITLYRKRKMEALEGRKLPERLRRRPVLFEELIEDAL